MSKLGIVITAAVCLPLGALLARPAIAQVRMNGLDPFPSETHFERAQDALHTALVEIQASERANEDVWQADSHHAVHARDAIAKAQRVTVEAANWAALEDNGPQRRLLRLSRIELP